MNRRETRIWTEEWDTNRRLAELGLTRDGLLRSRDTALAGRDSSGPFHCANTPGTYSYHEGVAGLREQFVGDAWNVCADNGIEGIRHVASGIKVGFQNVDIASNRTHDPKPISEKGSGSERAAQANLFGHNLPSSYKSDNTVYHLYYLMVDSDGACELSLPVIRKRKFEEFVERIFLDDGKDESRIMPLIDDGSAITDFDVPVSKKA